MIHCSQERLRVEAIERKLVNALTMIMKFCDIPSCLFDLVSKRAMELGIAGLSKYQKF